MNKLISIILCIALLSSLTAFDARDRLQLSGVQIAAGDGVIVSSQTTGRGCTLFLPGNADIRALPLQYELSHTAVLLKVKGSKAEQIVQNGEPLDLKSICGDSIPYTLEITASYGDQVSGLAVEIYPTDGIASMYLCSEDPVNMGRPWVESSPTKSNSAKGTMLMINEGGTVVYQDKLTQIKGRGNSTWLAEKKPYQIKLATKTDLLESGRSENVAKTWVLLTNHSDPSLLRNQTVYGLSVSMGMVPGIECRPVNLYYDGEYRGAYLLCEKVEIDKGRVDIEDLESSFEDANPDVDFDSLPVSTAYTANGAKYIYCPGLKDPENISGGYLLEMDTAVRAQAEKCYLITTRNTHIVVKSPEFCSKTAMDYIASYYQEFEDTLFNKGVHPTNGKTLADYADINSLAQCYIVNELTKNPDGYRTSCYFYKDADTDILMAGPIWDYDLSFGQGWGQFVPFCAETDRYFTLFSTFSKALYQSGDFRQAVHDIYLETVSHIVNNELLPALKEDRQALNHAARANNLVWNRSYKDWSNGCNTLINYITARNNWLTDAFATWSRETIGRLNEYHDVREEDWFFDAVVDATEFGLMNGMGFGIFSPHKTSTRAQSTKVLWAISGSPDSKKPSGFSDVVETEWYASAVAWAKENNVVNGYKNGTFAPNKEITRQELITIMYRHISNAKGSRAVLDDFKDGSEINSYAVDAMCWALENGIVKGYTDNTLRPRDPVSRAELATFMVRYYKAYFMDPLG